MTVCIVVSNDIAKKAQDLFAQSKVIYIQQGIELLLVNNQNVLAPNTMYQTDVTGLVQKALKTISNSPHEVLGIAIGASTLDIRKSYRRLALKYHPDKNPATTLLFQTIHAAYELLLDPNLRAAEERKANSRNPNNFSNVNNPKYNAYTESNNSTPSDPNLRSYQPKPPPPNNPPPVGRSNETNSNFKNDYHQKYANWNGYSNQNATNNPSNENYLNEDEMKRKQYYENFLKEQYKKAESDRRAKVFAEQRIRDAELELERKAKELAARRAFEGKHPRYSLDEEIQRDKTSAYLNGADGKQDHKNNSNVYPPYPTNTTYKVTSDGKVQPQMNNNPSSLPTVDPSNEPPKKIPRPYGLKCTFLSSSIVELEWKTPQLVNKKISIELNWRQFHLSGQWLSANKLVESGKCRKKNLVPGVKYEFRIRGVEELVGGMLGNRSDWSESLFITTLTTDKKDSEFTSNPAETKPMDSYVNSKSVAASYSNANLKGDPSTASTGYSYKGSGASSNPTTASVYPAKDSKVEPTPFPNVSYPKETAVHNTNPSNPTNPSLPRTSSSKEAWTLHNNNAPTTDTRTNQPSVYANQKSNLPKNFQFQKHLDEEEVEVEDDVKAYPPSPMRNMKNQNHYSFGQGNGLISDEDSSGIDEENDDGDEVDEEDTASIQAYSVSSKKSSQSDRRDERQPHKRRSSFNGADSDRVPTQEPTSGSSSGIASNENRQNSSSYHQGKPPLPPSDGEKRSFTRHSLDTMDSNTRKNEKKDTKNAAGGAPPSNPFQSESFDELDEFELDGFDMEEEQIMQLNPPNGSQNGSLYRHPVREEPFLKSKVVGYLLHGIAVRVTADCGHWLKVKVHLVNNLMSNSPKRKQKFFQDSQRVTSMSDSEELSSRKEDVWGWCIHIDAETSHTYLQKASSNPSLSRINSLKRMNSSIEKPPILPTVVEGRSEYSSSPFSSVAEEDGHRLSDLSTDNSATPIMDVPNFPTVIGNKNETRSRGDDHLTIGTDDKVKPILPTIDKNMKANFTENKPTVHIPVVLNRQSSTNISHKTSHSSSNHNVPIKQRDLRIHPLDNTTSSTTSTSSINENLTKQTTNLSKTKSKSRNYVETRHQKLHGISHEAHPGDGMKVNPIRLDKEKHPSSLHNESIPIKNMKSSPSLEPITSSPMTSPSNSDHSPIGRLDPVKIHDHPSSSSPLDTSKTNTTTTTASNHPHQHPLLAKTHTIKLDSLQHSPPLPKANPNTLNPLITPLQKNVSYHRFPSTTTEYHPSPVNSASSAHPVTSPGPTDQLPGGPVPTSPEKGSSFSAVDLWYELNDNDGNVYYFNELTGESKWDPPEWIEENDPHSGAKYYIHSNTVDPVTHSLKSTWSQPLKFSKIIRNSINHSP